MVKEGHQRQALLLLSIPAFYSGPDFVEQGQDFRGPTPVRASLKIRPRLCAGEESAPGNQQKLVITDLPDANNIERHGTFSHLPLAKETNGSIHKNSAVFFTEREEQ